MYQNNGNTSTPLWDKEKWKGLNLTHSFREKAPSRSLLSLKMSKSPFAQSSNLVSGRTLETLWSASWVLSVMIELITHKYSWNCTRPRQILSLGRLRARNPQLSALIAVAGLQKLTHPRWRWLWQKVSTTAVHSETHYWAIMIRAIRCGTLNRPQTQTSWKENSIEGTQEQRPMVRSGCSAQCQTERINMKATLLKPLLCSARVNKLLSLWEKQKSLRSRRSKVLTLMKLKKKMLNRSTKRWFSAQLIPSKLNQKSSNITNQRSRQKRMPLSRILSQLRNKRKQSKLQVAL